MADSSEAISVKGLNGLIKDLRGMPERLDKEIASGLKEIASGIASDAQAKAAGMSHPRVPRVVIASIKARQDGRSARISLGANNAPMAFGDEFGSYRFPQFPKPWGREGHFLYPAIREHREQTADKVGQLLDRVLGVTSPE